MCLLLEDTFCFHGDYRLIIFFVEYIKWNKYLLYCKVNVFVIRIDTIAKFSFSGVNIKINSNHKTPDRKHTDRFNQGTISCRDTKEIEICGTQTLHGIDRK